MDQRQSEIIIKNFGENLKKIRLEKGLSLRELADIADMNFGNINEIELGNVSPMLTTVFALADALEVDICTLLSISRK
jgi:transcriptional regulator with XRE-family HTH domain